MLSLEAARDSGIYLSLSPTICDSYPDVQAANHLGVKGHPRKPDPARSDCGIDSVYRTASSERSAAGGSDHSKPSCEEGRD